MNALASQMMSFLSLKRQVKLMVHVIAGSLEETNKETTVTDGLMDGLITGMRIILTKNLITLKEKSRRWQLSRSTCPDSAKTPFMAILTMFTTALDVRMSMPTALQTLAPLLMPALLTMHKLKTYYILVSPSFNK